MRKHILTHAILLALGATTLTGCGGGGSDSQNGGSNGTSQIKGTIVVPESNHATIQAASIGPRFQAADAANTACPNVPAGYAPLSNADVNLLDNQGNDLSVATTTDQCGNFTINNPPSSVNQIKASANGYHDIVVPVSTLVDSDNDGLIDPVSTFPDGSQLELTSLRGNLEKPP